MDVSALSEEVLKEADRRWSVVVADILADAADPKRFWYFNPSRVRQITVHDLEEPE